MKPKFTYILLLLICPFITVSQNKIDINATFDVDKDFIKIKQFIEYRNNSNDTLKTIYLNDWNNSFSTKKTPLAERFAEEYSTKFHFAKNEERGFTVITGLEDDNKQSLHFEHLEDHPDIVKVELSNFIAPQQAIKLHINYNVKIQSDKFTRYGVTPLKEYNLKYWYLTPSVYKDGKWLAYSNKNLDDYYTPKANINLQIEIPKNYVATTELDLAKTTQNQATQTIIFTGENRIDSKLFLSKLPVYRTIQTDYLSIVSNIKEKGLNPTDKAIITDKITEFISRNLGKYPHNKIIVSSIDAKKNPIYGLNQLPDFIRPFPKNFQFELLLLKNTISNYLDNTLLIDPRKDHWLKDGLETYFLIKYIEEHYPDTKLIGSLAKIWGVRSFHIADLDFNAQYGLTYMHMARTNRDQPLSMAKDSLLKFNKNLANKYKAGVGLKYLEDYLNADILQSSILEYLVQNKTNPTSPKDFETLLKTKTSKDLNWFFNTYVQSRKKIDFKIKKLIKTEDSITFTIKNKRETNVPISLFTLNNDSIISKTWINDIAAERTYTIPRKDINKLVLNYDNTIPEFNLRDNWKSLKGFFFNNKPLQLRLFQDVEDPYYNQVFVMPILEFRNIYDGVTVGGNFNNKTLLRKPFNYSISPNYSLKSKALTGGVSIYYNQMIEDKNLYNITYGFSASHSSYAEDLFATVLSPYLTFNFRDKNDFRSNKYQALNFRYVDISKDEDINNIVENPEPDYKIFNARYINTTPGLIDYNKWFADFQLSEKFGKLSFNYEYRKLFESNRQINLRFFAGTFLYNKNPENLTYFNFALDRPTDYLFDYNYLGRSEDSGIFSQQLIIAEGGFKSMLDTPYANQWITTMNTSTTIWRYIQAYGDIGFVKNKHHSPKFVYDSGIRLDLVTDYFEIYFPVYSNLGWEIAQPNYDQKIRFVFTVDPESLFGLFRRKWY